MSHQVHAQRIGEWVRDKRPALRVGNNSMENKNKATSLRTSKNLLSWLNQTPEQRLDWANCPSTPFRIKHSLTQLRQLPQLNPTIWQTHLHGFRRPYAVRASITQMSLVDLVALILSGNYKHWMDHDGSRVSMCVIDAECPPNVHKRHGRKASSMISMPAVLLVSAGQKNTALMTVPLLLIFCST